MTRVARLSATPTFVPPADALAEPAPSTRSDLEQVRLRRNAAQCHFWPMSLFLSKLLGRDMNRTNLLKVAKVIADARQVKLDRLAKRTKEILIVWFCENALDLMQDPSAPILRRAVAGVRASNLEPPEGGLPQRPKPMPFPSLAEMGLLAPLPAQQKPHLPWL
jgi:hypothetical protein